MIGHNLNLDIKGGSGALSEIQSALDSLWPSNAHVRCSIRNQVAMAVAEIAANIIEHARASSIRMEVRIHPNEVEVKFTDNGRPAEIDLTSVRMPGAMAERGRGLAIALAALQEVSYCRRGSANHWRLISHE
jgi:serine/threonine-protein kinase RsbW